MSRPNGRRIGRRSHIAGHCSTNAMARAEILGIVLRSAPPNLD